MAQKVNPVLHRLGIIRSADSKWYSESKYGSNVLQSLSLRNHIEKTYSYSSMRVGRIGLLNTKSVWYAYVHAYMSDVNTLSKSTNHSVLPLPAKQNLGRFLSKKATLNKNLYKSMRSLAAGHIYGQSSSKVLYTLAHYAKKHKTERSFNKSLTNAWRYTYNQNLHLLALTSNDLYASSHSVADYMKNQLEKRTPIRRLFKELISGGIKHKHVSGIKLSISGRINGAAIARSESKHWGRVPLHGFNNIIDYTSIPAYTSYGILGIKVWLCYDKI